MNSKPGKMSASRFTKKRIALLATGFLLAGVIWLLFLQQASDGPIYHGKTARQWLRDGFASNSGNPLEAFDEMGSNAVPFLVGELERKDSTLDQFYQWIFPKLPMRIEAHLSPRQDQHERWALASLALQTGNPRNAIPRLLRVLSKGEKEQQELVLPVLCGIVGPNDTNCIPAFVNCLKSTNVAECIMATDVLERLKSGRLAIATLTNFLVSTDSMVRLKCLDRLARIDSANSNEWRKLETNEPAWEIWQQKVRAGKSPVFLLPGQE